MKEAWARQYEQDGYVVIQGLFGEDEMKACKEEIRRIVERKDGAGKADGYAMHGVFVGLAKESELFRRMAVDTRLAEVLKAIIGEQALFLSDKVVAKDAKKDFASPWHQDWMYWEGSHKLSVWIALDEATPENGCLRMIPGSHRTAVSHALHIDSRESFASRLRPEDIDESKVVAIPAKVGTAVFFHDLTIHASYSNVSGKDRWALISTYKDAADPDPDLPWAYPIPVV
ncbi:phytanoyl-CoA dioxygenase family protein [Cohnella silvisoli]|uniref:Phytanoyl-CoA dioxygenase family protein n=1 Tax=Cohnella silvisoli TaxID=2873699 RepID=A0ABV1L2J3_9BACL|nr:phytanoyl-CoA dioxygenase family protein [Cohnella silvisoli]MCD9021590.1 phytanoyl-CoA dioxygenase family protein [Cohnella silvisoli]